MKFKFFCNGLCICSSALVAIFAFLLSIILFLIIPQTQGYLAGAYLISGIISFLGGLTEVYVIGRDYKKHIEFTEQEKIK